jgi:LacI family transcriptional regulator
MIECYLNMETVFCSSDGPRLSAMKDAVFVCDPDIRIAQQIAVGLSGELQKHDAWTIHVLPNLAPLPELKRQIREIKPDAITASCPSSQLAEHLESLDVPLVVVAIRGDAKPHTPTILPDDGTIGAMAAEYLLAQTFEHFAVVDKDRREPAPRIDVFCRAIRGQHKALDTLRLESTAATDHPFGVRADMKKVAEWLELLPKPCAVFAHSDQIGAYLIRACARHDIRVPEEVSVLGVDDDPLYCHTVMPNLASVHLPYSFMGTEAARMILGRSPMRSSNVPPTTVVERASCRPPRRGDPLVDQALEHLRTEVAEGVRVRDLQELTGLTSHQLVYRFNIVTGRTPMEMILRQRISVAKRLLAETTEPVASIARQSGFNSTNQFYVTFRNHVGISPSDYRARLAP